MLLGQDRKHGSMPNLKAMDHPRHRLLQVLTLPHQVQDLRIHDSYNCWLISYSFSAAHPLNMPVAMHSSDRKPRRRPIPHHRKRYTSKVKRKVSPRLMRHHSRLGLLPPPHPQHLLPILPHQVGNHIHFHCGSDSFFFSAVHLPICRWPLTLQHLDTYLISQSADLLVMNIHLIVIEPKKGE
ncbi:hypothetical protein BDR07DRAFT_191633 [Suillus spraguei]|nr:hypothetical protein BDR07DRAFT_191633 [Suillus spraguei]